MTVLEPPDLPTLSAMLATANANRQAVLPRGSGTRMARGAPAARADVTLSLAGLPKEVEHCSGDLTATLSASATLAEVNARLAEGGQRLPLDPLFSEHSTIGGLIAANASGPARHRYGAPRDLIIGVELALADGRLAKAGGRVVKNVAGYDLARLVCGSFGSLAVITRATFKLVPLQQSTVTVAVTSSAADATRRLAEAGLAVAAQPLTPTAVDLDAPSSRLLLRFESTVAAADRQASAAARFFVDNGLSVARIDDGRQDVLWQDRAARVWDGTVVRVAVRPTDIGAMLDTVAGRTQEHGLSWRATGHAVLGVFYVGLHGPDHAQAAAITGIRQAVESRRGSAVVLAAGPPVMGLLDPWGDAGSGFRLMQAVKARFDPFGTLNPGGGPGGL